MADKDKQNVNSGKNSDGEAVTNPKYSEFNAPQIGGVSSQGADSEEGIFKNESGPVRDRQPDSSKGTPVKRFFTKDGTPVEPTTIPTGVTPSNLMPPDENMRDDVVAAWEYLDDGGNVVTQDTLKRQEESKNRSNK